MQALARAATRSLMALFIVLVLVVIAVAAIGILSTEAAMHQGDAIAGDELTTAIATSQLGRNMDAAYAAGEQAALATQPATRSRLLGSLYTSLLPAVDARAVVAGTAARRRPAGRARRPRSCSSGSGPPSVTCSARPTSPLRPPGRSPPSWPPPTSRSARTWTG